MLSLGNCGWVHSRHNLVITGPTGIGKSYLACAFVERACRRGYKAAYLRLPRLLQQLAVARGDGSYTRILERLARFELLAIDDWLLAPLRDAERRDPHLADSICDRLLHNAHRIKLKGPSRRRTKADPKAAPEKDA